MLKPKMKKGGVSKSTGRQKAWTSQKEDRRHAQAKNEARSVRKSTGRQKAWTSQ
jgi:hypothetical protein